MAISHQLRMPGQNLTNTSKASWCGTSGERLRMMVTAGVV